MKVEFRGRTLVVGIVIVGALLALRVASLGESDDPDLRRAVRIELLSRLGARTGEDLENLARPGGLTTEAARELLRRVDPTDIEIHGLAVSRPLLSMASCEKVVVRVDFSLPEAEPQREYWRFEHCVGSGWRRAGRTGALSYWLNLL